jgi:hypothetical protein
VEPGLQLRPDLREADQLEPDHDVNGTAIRFDSQGKLTHDGVNSYTSDISNRMLSQLLGDERQLRLRRRRPAHTEDVQTDHYGVRVDARRASAPDS